MGNREEDKDNVRMSFQSKVFYNRLIIFFWFVYSKSAIFKAIQNPVHKHRAILYRKIGQATSTAGRQGAAPILDIRKGGYYKQQVSTKAKVQRRQGDPPHGSQPWRSREPQENEGRAVSNGKPLTVGAIHPKAVSVSRFLPASSREKRARKRNHDGSATI